MVTTRTRQRITNLFEELVISDKKIHNADLLVHSDSNQLHVNLAEGNAKINANDSVQVEQPMFMASVGKLSPPS